MRLSTGVELERRAGIASTPPAAVEDSSRLHCCTLVRSGLGRTP